MKMFARRVLRGKRLRLAAGLAVAFGWWGGGSNRVEAGTLSGSITQIQLLNVNLTTQGTTDWAVWGEGSSASLNPSDRKLGGVSISSLTDISQGNPLRGLGQFGIYAESTFAWSNGSPTLSASNVTSGLQHDSNNGPNHNLTAEGFSFTLPALTTLQEVTLYFTDNVGVAAFTASLSDNSAAGYSQVFNAGTNSNYPGILTLDFAANSLGQTLTITGTVSGGQSANVAFQAVALSVPTVPEPAAWVPLALGGVGLAWLAGRRSCRDRPA